MGSNGEKVKYPAKHPLTHTFAALNERALPSLPLTAAVGQASPSTRRRCVDTKASLPLYRPIWTSKTSYRPFASTRISLCPMRATRMARKSASAGPVYRTSVASHAVRKCSSWPFCGAWPCIRFSQYNLPPLLFLPSPSPCPIVCPASVILLPRFVRHHLRFLLLKGQDIRSYDNR